MNKRITSFAICFVLVVAMLVSAVPAFAADETCICTIKADKAVANPGDTITFTVSVQQTGDLSGLEGVLKIPAGLTYVANSAVVDGSVNATIFGWTGAQEGVAWTEGSMYLNGLGSVGFTGTQDVTLLTFKCTVDNDASFKSYDVTMEDFMAYYSQNYFLKNVTIVPATVSVEAKPVAVTGVTLSETVGLTEGEYISLDYEVLPADASNKGVSFKSSNDAVATVDAAGKVTAVKEGTATITVTTADGGFTDTCVVTVTKAPCTHTSKTATAAKTATCKEGGWDAYSTCDDCGQLFDALGAAIAKIPTTPVDDDNHGTKTATPAKDADCEEGGWDAYSTCDDCGQVFDALGAEIAAIPTTPIDPAKHINTTVNPAKAGDCVNPGHAEFTWCNDCETVIAGSNAPVYGEHNYGTLIPATGEVHTSTELKAAVAAHYICSVCDKYFTEAKVETTLGALTGDTPAHAYNDAWKTDDTNHWHDCDCGKTIDTAKHAWKWVIDKAASTTETGLKHEECTVCKLTRNEDTVIDKITNTHSHKYSAWKFNSHIHWMVCDCGLVHQNADSHTWEWHTAKFPTKTETGLKYQSCYYCGAVQNVNTVIPKLEADHTHKYDATKADKNGHWTECACGEKTEVKAHSFVWVIDVAATETATGLKHEECSVCKFKQNENTVISVIKPADTDKPADTTAPSDTSTPADTQKPTGGNAAQTGDLNIVAVLIIAGIAVIGAGAAIFFGKKARVR